MKRILIVTALIVFSNSLYSQGFNWDSRMLRVAYGTFPTVLSHHKSSKRVKVASLMLSIISWSFFEIAIGYGFSYPWDAQ